MNNSIVTKYAILQCFIKQIKKVILPLGGSISTSSSALFLRIKLNNLFSVFTYTKKKKRGGAFQLNECIAPTLYANIL